MKRHRVSSPPRKLPYRYGGDAWSSDGDVGEDDDDDDDAPVAGTIRGAGGVWTDDDRVVNPDRPPGEDPVMLPKELMEYIKPHQRDGVRFLWKTVQQDTTKGCLLAHSMGLGKTFQVFAFVYLLLRQEPDARVLVVVPKVTLANWVNEFKIWGTETCHLTNPPPVSCADDVLAEGRIATIHKWYHERKGVCVIGYEMYTRLVLKDDSADRRMIVCLANPGPELVVLDEGHRIKSPKSSYAQALGRVQTRRRVILTGYPLQNHLMEFHTMIDWIRPGHWDADEFKRHYVDPITDGQMTTAPDRVRDMRQRLFMLTDELRGFVQRADQGILERDLPPKVEFVVSIRLTPVQVQLYTAYQASTTDTNALQVTSMVQKICNHPDILRKFFMRSSTKKNKKKKKDKEENPEAKSAWWKSVFNSGTYLVNQVEYGGKMMALFRILEYSVKQSEKVLVFSQYTETLDAIQAMLEASAMPGKSVTCWRRNEDFLRLDGTTTTHRRSEMIARFNRPSSAACLFLISTRAGGIGINLTAASRVVVFDFCWNPCHDNQAIFRAYRYGQTRPVFIYRLVARGTVEDKIYQAQVSKMWLFSRVVDDKAPVSRLGADIDLLQYTDDGRQGDVSAAHHEDANVLGKVVDAMGSQVSEVRLHDSLFKEDTSQRLTPTERQQAMRTYGFLRDLKGKQSRQRDRNKVLSEHRERTLKELHKQVTKVEEVVNKDLAEFLAAHRQTFEDMDDLLGTLDKIQDGDLQPMEGLEPQLPPPGRRPPMDEAPPPPPAPPTASAFATAANNTLHGLPSAGSMPPLLGQGSPPPSSPPAITPVLTDADRERLREVGERGAAIPGDKLAGLTMDTFRPPPPLPSTRVPTLNDLCLQAGLPTPSPNLVHELLKFVQPAASTSPGQSPLQMLMGGMLPPSPLTPPLFPHPNPAYPGDYPPRGPLPRGFGFAVTLATSPGAVPSPLTRNPPPP